ncbi:MAG: fibronectin type III domain-containing protein [Flavobacteriales bacterium]|nr:fibronectin type III domain-containing protein [Flavobacteriales bacterium]MBP6696546.1 fibronectin type III domain-containing protein [Flavobacteriales bacterium]
MRVLIEDMTHRLSFPKRNLPLVSVVPAPNCKTMNVTCIRAGVKDISSPALVAKAMHIEKCMLNNPHFPAPVPSIAAIAAMRTDLEHWLVKAEGGGFAAIATRWEKHTQLERSLVQLSKYVMAQAQGDIERQVSSGFELRRPPLKITDLNAPSVLNAKRSEHEGGVKLAWSRVHGARTYQVFVNVLSTAGEEGWRLVVQTTRIRAEVLHLEPGQYHHFRVRAVFAAGEGPMGTTIGCRAA